MQINLTPLIYKIPTIDFILKCNNMLILKCEGRGGGVVEKEGAPPTPRAAKTLQGEPQPLLKGTVAPGGQRPVRWEA